MKLPLGKAALLATAAFTVAAMLAPISASAQEVRNLDNARSDVQIFDGTVGAEPVRYRVTMERGSFLQVDVRPTEGSLLDPVLTITDVRTGEVLAEDDDSGGNLASSARVRSDVRRQVELSITSFAFYSGEESGGPFELQLRRGEFTVPRTEPIAFGGSASGRVSTGAPRYYTVTGAAGQLLEVALLAEDESIDPLLSLYDGTDIEGDILASDDDGGEGLNSLLRYTLPKAGTYTIAAGAYGESSGSYTLRVAAQRGPVEPAGLTSLGLAQSVSGYLAAPSYPEYPEYAVDAAAEAVAGLGLSQTAPSGNMYQLSASAISAIRAGAGEVTVDMTHPKDDDSTFPSGVDPYLELGFETPLGFASMMTNDDGGEEGLNSRIAVDLTALAADGDWLERLRIRASSIGGGGAYDIQISEGLLPVREPYAYDEAAEAVEAVTEVVPYSD